MENENQFQPQQPQYSQPNSLPNATAVLILGIISIVGCFCYGIVGIICGIIALVLAKKDLKLYNENPSGYSSGSYNNLKSGRICAIVGLSMSAVYIIVLIFLIISVGIAGLSHPWALHNYNY